MLHPITEHKGLLLTSAFKMNSSLSSPSSAAASQFSREKPDLCDGDLIKRPLSSFYIANKGHCQKLLSGFCP